MAAPLAQYLQSIASLWLEQIKLCEKAKSRDFGNAADEIMHYAGKQYSPRLPGSEYPTAPEDETTTIVNYTQLFVDTLTSYVFAQVPSRLTTPSRSQIPPELEQVVPKISAMQAELRRRDTIISYELNEVLNWFPKIYNLGREGEIAVREALAKGRGCLWVEMGEGPNGMIPVSMADSVDNLLIDADAKQLRNAGFIVRIRRQVAWKIAELYGEDVNEIRTHAASSLAMATATANHTEDDKQGKSDLATYYEIWSVMGIGHKLIDAPDDLKETGLIQDALDSMGPYTHFAVMPGMDHPLGMSPKKIEALATDADKLAVLLQKLLVWPIKTYGKLDNPWPVICLDFKPNVDNPWATAILETALPLLRFIDTIYNSLMVRARKSSRDIIITSLELDPEVETAIKGLDDLVIVRISENASHAIKDLIEFFQFPSVNKDVYETLRLTDAVFRELTGLDPSLMGSAPHTQERSAKASGMRESGLSRRPNEYADKVESFMSEDAATEAIAARMLVGPKVVAPLYGEQILDAATGLPATKDTEEVIYGELTLFWINLVMTDDPWAAAAEMIYSVEAGSGRRRNKQLQQENSQQLYTMFSQQLFAIGTSLGDIEGYLMLLRMVGEAYEMPVEPIITKIREAFARNSQQPAEGKDGDSAKKSDKGGTPQSPPSTIGGAAALSQWMGAAGGPRKLNLSPPPGTV